MRYSCDRIWSIDYGISKLVSLMLSIFISFSGFIVLRPLVCILYVNGVTQWNILTSNQLE